MRALLNDLATTFAILTRLPVSGADPANAPGAAARSVWAFPLAGLAVGGLGAVVLLAAHWAGVYGMPAAGLALAAQILVTGALHEDGLADVADGFGGGADKAAKLKIMRDSRIGAYGVLALVLVVVLKWAALASFSMIDGAHILVVAGVLGRLAMVGVLVQLSPAREGGFGATVAGPPALSSGAALILGIAAALLVLPAVQAGVALAAMFVCAAAMAWLARAQIGGYTGDVLGATQQVTEAAVFLALMTTQ